MAVNFKQPIITCVMCGTSCQRTGKNQKRCTPCQQEMARLRSNAHSKARTIRKRFDRALHPDQVPSNVSNSPVICEDCGDTVERVSNFQRRCGACAPDANTWRRTELTTMKRAGNVACGECIDCPKNAKQEAMPNCRHCFKHWILRLAKGNRDTKQNPELAKALAFKWAEQNGRCAYTGVELVPGVNASIDHIVPYSRGGQNCAENVHWVDRLINRMKTDMLPNEFIATCAHVAATCKTV